MLCYSICVEFVYYTWNLAIFHINCTYTQQEIHGMTLLVSYGMWEILAWLLGFSRGMALYTETVWMRCKFTCNILKGCLLTDTLSLPFSGTYIVGTFCQSQSMLQIWSRRRSSPLLEPGKASLEWECAYSPQWWSTCQQEEPQYTFQRGIAGTLCSFNTCPWR
jgi:hypothetical protein